MDDSHLRGVPAGIPLQLERHIIESAVHHMLLANLVFDWGPAPKAVKGLVLKLSTIISSQ